MWRALVGLTGIELAAVQHVARNGRTAVFFDARSAEEFGAGSLPGSRSIPQGAVQPGEDMGEVLKAKDDGRLPMNVSYFPGDLRRVAVGGQVGSAAFC